MVQILRSVAYYRPKVVWMTGLLGRAKSVRKLVRRQAGLAGLDLVFRTCRWVRLEAISGTQMPGIWGRNQ